MKYNFYYYFQPLDTPLHIQSQLFIALNSLAWFLDLQCKRIIKRSLGEKLSFQRLHHYQQCAPADPSSKLGQVLHLQAFHGTLRGVQGVNSACSVSEQEGAPHRKEGSGINSHEGGLSEKGLCLSSRVYKQFSPPLLSLPLPSPPLSSPLLPFVSVSVSLSLCLYVSLFFFIFQFLKRLLRI